ncbi:DUF1254 domain-containing protein [Agaribacterium sp. ZY112]|uniref:DUF1254 domain-containing protein n=1 Tax=Agaribacterium sp. ZY112 TaxID=3233574 RepID=UPI003523DEB4
MMLTYKLLSSFLLASSVSVTALASAPIYKANVADSLLTPDRSQSKYLGEVHMVDGFPSEETSRKAFDFLDTSRAVQLYTSGMPMASMYAMLEGNAKVGVEANRTVGITEQLMDARSIWLTPNTTTPYISAEVDVKNGPVVVEVGSPVIGLLNDAYFHYVADIGMGGPDKGQGGKYLIVGDAYDGEIPEGYFVYRTSTYRHWLLIRAVAEPNSSLEDTIAKFKRGFKMYPLAEAAKPKANNYVNLSKHHSSTIHSADHSFYNEINAVIQYEPANSGDSEIIGLADALGIKKGKTFSPDERMLKIFSEAATIANAASRATLYRPRNPEMYIYENKPWITSTVQSHEFLNENGARILDDRMAFHFYATGITPFMVDPQVGSGSVYAVTTMDQKGDMLSGDKTYIVTLPEGIPAKDFWSLMVYDNQTRSILETNQKSGGVDSLQGDPVVNDDGSITIYFSSKAPEGKEQNWVQTMPGKGFNVILRLYGPLQSWFDKSWQPSGLEVFSKK